MITKRERYREILAVFTRHGIGVVDDQFIKHEGGGRACAEHLRRAFEELGTTFIKLGQALSTRADLPWGVQQRWIKPAATRAGLGDGIGWHTLRHTYRTLLDETEPPLKVQQELMRHTDIRATMNIYGAVPSSSKRDANSKVVRMVVRKAAECKPNLNRSKRQKEPNSAPSTLVDLHWTCAMRATHLF
jgi:hypothetical protein